jgi:hypothetical protein
MRLLIGLLLALVAYVLTGANAAALLLIEPAGPRIDEREMVRAASVC